MLTSVKRQFSQNDTLRLGRGSMDISSTLILTVKVISGTPTFTIIPVGEVMDSDAPSSTSDSLYTERRSTGVAVPDNTINTAGNYGVVMDAMDVLLLVTVAGGTIQVAARSIRN